MITRASGGTVTASSVVVPPPLRDCHTRTARGAARETHMPAPGSAEAADIVDILRRAASVTADGIVYPHMLQRSLYMQLRDRLPPRTLWLFLQRHAAEFEIIGVARRIGTARGFRLREGTAGVSAAAPREPPPRREPPASQPWQHLTLHPPQVPLSDAPGPGLATALVAHFESQSAGKAGVVPATAAGLGGTREQSSVWGGGAGVSAAPP